MSRIPITCLSCRLRPCEQAPNGALDLCPYGIVFLVSGDEILRQDPTLPIKHLAANLRHELNPILSLVVNEVSTLEPKLSTRRVDTGSSLGRILGAALMLDDTVQMITGVHDMHLLSGPQNLSSSSVDIEQVVRNKFAIYSLTGGANRARGLRLSLQNSGLAELRYGVPLLEYVIAVLMDNAWKFSEDDTTVTAAVSRKAAGLADLVVSNQSSPLPDDLDVFQLGAKGSSDSKGFGYGLYWAQLLVDRYSAGLNDGRPALEIEYRQHVEKADRAIHQFSLRYLRVAEDEETP